MALTSDEEWAREREELVTELLEKLQEPRKSIEKTVDIFIKAAKEVEREFEEEDLDLGKILDSLGRA